MNKVKLTKTIALLLAVLSFAACGQKSQTESKADTASGSNQISQSATGSQPTDSTTTGSGTVSSDESEVVSSEAVDMTDVLPWPTNFISGVPELAGKINNIVYEDNTYATVYLHYVEKSDFTAYVTTIKSLGYTSDTNETTDADSILYSGYNSKGEYIEVTYQIEDKKADVYMIKAE